MLFKEFMDMCISGGNLYIKDTNCRLIASGSCFNILNTRKDLYNREVVKFGLGALEDELKIVLK